MTSSNLPDHITLGQARAWLRSRLDEGAHCPCCTQLSKTYKRKINSGMARSLIHMHRSAGQEWIHVKLIGAQSREEGKLAYWGLVEEQKATGLHGGRAGYWRVTDSGVAFLKLQLTVPKYARVYDGKVRGYEGPMVTIKDALGTRFDYNELMAGL